MLILRRSLFLSFTLALSVAAQDYTAYTNQSDVTSASDSLWYTVAGTRHGPSFFARQRYPEVEYEPGRRLTFDRYHTVEVMYHWLRQWAEEYPDLVELYEVGRSFEGRPILQVTLTNKRTGPDTDKPAAFFEGGRHSGEITSSESVLWLIQHLLENYNRDYHIKQLLDTKALYLRPQNNPDGSELYLNTLQANRSTVRPHDSDRDGLIDEDPGEDLDGDGILYQMRWRVREDDADKGNAILDERDPQERLMLSAPEGTGDWRVATEGLDSDGDGKYNEDGIGGLDLHRNYPENWRPDTGLDQTGRGYTQFGAGEYPLSEPETRSVFLWLITHPNVSVANSMDTRVPMHLRPPSTSHSKERMYPDDLDYYVYFDTLGQRITGYPYAGDVYEGFFTRYPTNLATGEPSKPNPLFGHGPDFGYFYYGAIWYGDELWNNGALEDYNSDGMYDNLDALEWDERHNRSRGFKPWEPFDHPELGAVEIGGFHPKFFAQNGPPEVLERWARNQALFNLEMALHLPQISIEEAVPELMNVNGDTATYAIRVAWTNTGRIPTALEQALLVKIVKEDHAVLEFDEELTAQGSERVFITRPDIRDKALYAGRTKPDERKLVTFIVKVLGREPVEGTAKVNSTRGGVVERPFIMRPATDRPRRR